MEPPRTSQSAPHKDDARDAERAQRVEAFAEDCCSEAYRAILPRVELVADSDSDDCCSSEPPADEQVLVFAPHLAAKPAALESFEDSRLSAQTRQAAALLGLRRPTPIQMHSTQG